MTASKDTQTEVTTPQTLDLSFMDTENWENAPFPLPSRVTCRFANGAVHHTYSRQALALWIRENGAVIVALGEDDTTTGPTS